MFPWSLTGISLATEWGSTWVTVREKVNIWGCLDFCYLRGPPKVVGKEFWRSVVQPQLKPGSTPTSNPVNDGFLWPGHENPQGWKFLSVYEHPSQCCTAMIMGSHWLSRVYSLTVGDLGTAKWYWWCRHSFSPDWHLIWSCTSVCRLEILVEPIPVQGLTSGLEGSGSPGSHTCMVLVAPAALESLLLVELLHLPTPLQHCRDMEQDRQTFREALGNEGGCHLPQPIRQMGCRHEGKSVPNEVADG